MKPIYSAVIAKYAAACLAACLALFAQCPFAFAADSADESEAAYAVNHTAFTLYKILAPDGENFCFSPYSVSNAFAMAYAGARNGTAEEIKAAFKYGDNIHVSNRVLTNMITAPPAGSGELLSANSVWPQVKYRLSGDFRRNLKDNYSLEPSTVDFEKHPEAARAEINDWVARKTKDLIKDLLPAGSVGTDTRMVLVNAVYLKASWLKPFDSGRTEDALFWTKEGPISVQTMNKTEYLSFAENDVARSVRIPYRQGMFSMTILVPKEGTRLSHIENALSEDFLKTLYGDLQKRLVDLYLPRFKVESGFELTDALRSIGVRSAFDRTSADFSGINKNRDLYIGASVHRAFVDVDEEGTEAAASTALTMTRTGMAPGIETDPLVFKVDRPFVFFIRDEIAKSILFIGRINDPTPLRTRD